MSTEYPGPLCKAADITSAFLITLADQPDVRTVISPDIITNGLIVELEFFRKEITKLRSIKDPLSWAFCFLAFLAAKTGDQEAIDFAACNEALSGC